MPGDEASTEAEDAELNEEPQAEPEPEPAAVAAPEGVSKSPSMKCSGPLRFEDPGLELAVRQKLKKPVSTITAEEVATIESFGYGDDPGSKEPVDLEPLRCFTSLVELNLTNIRVKDLTPIGALPNLRVIRLVNNGLRDISSLVNQRALLELRVTDNPITGLGALAKMTQLVTLELNNVGLKDGAFLGKMRSLTNLSVANNKVTSLSFIKALTALQYLDASNNRIKTFPKMSGIPNIYIINLSKNQIADLSPLVWENGNPNGGTLELMGNPIDCDAQRKNLELLTVMWPTNLATDCPGFYRMDP